MRDSPRPSFPLHFQLVLAGGEGCERVVEVGGIESSISHALSLTQSGSVLLREGGWPEGHFDTERRRMGECLSGLYRDETGCVKTGPLLKSHQPQL